MKTIQWLLCPVCKSKTRLQIITLNLGLLGLINYIGLMDIYIIFFKNTNDHIHSSSFSLTISKPVFRYILAAKLAF